MRFKDHPIIASIHNYPTDMKFLLSSSASLDRNRTQILSKATIRHGFTLIEVLVVVTIVIVLAGIALTVSGAARLNANKTADMQNLRSLAVAAMAAGSDNAGRLPTLHPASTPFPYWLQSRETLQTYGLSKESCYAPTRNISGGAPRYDWWYNHGASTPTHYVYFANDGTTMSNGWSTRGQVVPPSNTEYRGAIPYDDIIKDPTKAFARTTTDDAWYPVLWAGLCRDFSGTPTVAAIMKNKKPLGANIMYLDGHAEWVPYAKMKARYTAGALKLFW